MLRRMGSAGLGFGQLFALIFGFLITSALIFLFGIWVGRDVTERRLAQEERIVRMTVPEQPTPKEEEKDVDLSFYRGLKEKAYQRLQETAAPVPSTPTPAPVAQTSTPTRPPRRVTEKPKPIATSAPPARAKQGEMPAPGKEWADAGWTVQVNATTNPQQASDLARGLRAKGYDAYTVQAPMRGQTWYRVRVGRFTSRDKAKEIEARLKSNEGLENAYVTPQ
ncbi:MAG: SPOR domain-containing protein [Candidatus Binatia bacterium]